MTQVQFCKDLWMSKSALQSWVNEACLHRHGFEPAEVTVGYVVQARMLNQVQGLEQENKILGQATAYLPKANLIPGRPAQNNVPAGP